MVAAGACGSGRQLAAALAMGACGITMATRFLATKEAPIHPKIKEIMARPDVDERQTTIVLSKFSNATRVFDNKIAREIREIEGIGNAGRTDFKGSLEVKDAAEKTSGIFLSTFFLQHKNNI